MLGKYILDSLVLDVDVRGLVVVSSDVRVCNVLRPDVGVEIGAVVVMSTDVRFDGGADVDSNVDVDIKTGVVVFSDAEVDVLIVLECICLSKHIVITSWKSQENVDISNVQSFAKFFLNLVEFQFSNQQCLHISN